jgi:hypothetical protein
MKVFVAPEITSDFATSEIATQFPPSPVVPQRTGGSTTLNLEH